MKTRLCISIRTTLLACFFILAPLTAKAFDMLEYWPIKPPAAWVMDYEMFILTNDTLQFANLPGQKMFTVSTFCEDGLCGQNYFYIYSGPGGLLILGVYEEGTLIDLSATPIKIVEADMTIGQSTVTVIPAGTFDADPITLTVHLVAQENVTVPAGIYENTLVLQIDITDSPTTNYREKVWLAQNVGPVKIERISETPENHDGCFFTCGSFNLETSEVVNPLISLQFALGVQPMDVNNDGKLGLAEAIYTLKTLAGDQ